MAKFLFHFTYSLFFLIFISRPALYAMDYEAGIDIYESYLSQTHYMDRYQNRFSYDERSNLMALGPHLRVNPKEEASVYFRGYLYWQYFFMNNASEEREVDVYINDTYLEFKNKKWDFRLGLQPVQFGKEFIFSDDAIAASIDVNRGPVYLSICGARVMDNSPMLGGSIGYRFNLFQDVEAFALYYEDREDAFSKTLRPYLSVSNLTDDGYLSWIGLSSDLLIGDFYFSVLGAYQHGQANFSYTGGQSDRDISAYLFDVSMETNLTDRISIGLFCFVASGDKQPFRDDFSAFISPLPYNHRSFIFFNPDFIHLDENSSLVFGGTTPYGVIAPGFTFTISTIQDLLIECTTSLLYPQYKPSPEKSWYGWEADLEMSYRFDKSILFMEIDRFEHGDFFNTDTGYEPEDAFRFSIGIQMYFY